jgi:drug/metabolite transporter (DMT)-like permease
VLWAANGVSVKRATGLDVYQANAVRYGIAFVVLAPQAFSSRGPMEPLSTFVPILPAILADAVFGSFCFVYGFTHSDLAVAATLTSLAPLISLPIAIALGEETWSLARVLAVGTIVSGVVLLVSGGGS